MGAYKDKKGTWPASAQYKNWTGETKRKMKRGFHTKREAFVWKQKFIAKNNGKVHYQQHNRHLDDSRNRGDPQDLVIDVLHAFSVFFRRLLLQKRSCETGNYIVRNVMYNSAIGDAPAGVKRC